MAEFKKWHGLRPQYYRVKQEIIPAISVDYDENPAEGELIFRLGKKEERFPIEVCERTLGRYQVEILQDSFLARLNQFTLTVVPQRPLDSDFRKVRKAPARLPNYCTPWIAREETALRIDGPEQVPVKSPSSVVITMMCQYEHKAEIPELPPSPTLTIMRKDTGGVLRRAVHEIVPAAAQKPPPREPKGKGKGKSKGKEKQKPKQIFTADFFTVDVGPLLEPGTYGIVAVYGIFESNPITVTVGDGCPIKVPDPQLVEVEYAPGTERVHAGKFQLAIRHAASGSLVDYALATNPKAKVSLLDGTSLGPTPVKFQFGPRATFRLVDKTKELRRVVTVQVKPEPKPERRPDEDDEDDDYY